MSRQTITTILVASAFAVFVPRAGAQGQCVPLQDDPRREPFDATENELDYTIADALVMYASNLIQDVDDSKYRMLAEPWVLLDYHPPNLYPGCSDRDYHAQPSSYGFGSAVLVGMNVEESDRIFTAGHVLRGPTGARLSGPAGNLAVVFGYGNYSPNQWQLTCEPEGDCYVIVDKSDVYFCVQQWDNYPAQDWAVGRLDRKVTGRHPLQIHDDPLTTPSTNLVIVGHPNRIPMKVEGVQLTSWAGGGWNSTGHVLNHSSGSMAVDASSNKVIGAVSGGNSPHGEGCNPPPNESGCEREDFASTVNQGAGGSAAYLGAAYIP